MRRDRPCRAMRRPVRDVGDAEAACSRVVPRCCLICSVYRLKCVLPTMIHTCCDTTRGRMFLCRGTRSAADSGSTVRAALHRECEQRACARSCARHGMGNCHSRPRGAVCCSPASRNGCLSGAPEQAGGGDHTAHKRALKYPVTQIAIAVDRNKSTVYRALSIDLRQQIYRASRAGGPPGWQRKRDGLAGGGPGGQRTAPGGPGGRPGGWRTGPGGPTQVARQAGREAGRHGVVVVVGGGGGGGAGSRRRGRAPLKRRHRGFV